MAVYVMGVFQNSANTWISDNETYWYSTSIFKPILSGDYGSIRLGKHIVMSFNIQYHGRTDINTYEQIFRLGFESIDGSCFGQNSRYPSLWIAPNQNMFFLSISCAINCGDPYPIHDIALHFNETYQFYIDFNESWIFVKINDTIVINKQRPSGTLQSVIGNRINVFIGSDYWIKVEPYIMSDATLWDINISSFDIPTPPTVITDSPSNYPTSIPSISPTNEPSLLPTNIPTLRPTIIPTVMPTNRPTASPTSEPSKRPSKIPTYIPTTITPTTNPSLYPTTLPTIHPSIPTVNPSADLTHNPTPYSMWSTITYAHPTLAAPTASTITPISTTKPYTDEPTTLAPTLTTTFSTATGSTAIIVSTIESITDDIHNTDAQQQITKPKQDYDLVQLFILFLAGLVSCCIGCIMFCFTMKRCNKKRQNHIHQSVRAALEMKQYYANNTNDTNNKISVRKDKIMKKQNYIKPKADACEEIEFKYDNSDTGSTTLTMQHKYLMSESEENKLLNELDGDINSFDVNVQIAKNYNEYTYNNDIENELNQTEEIINIVDMIDTDDDLPVLPEPTVQPLQTGEKNLHGGSCDEYEWIRFAFLQIDQEEYSKYVDNFMKNKVTDDRLQDLTDNDLNLLIPEIGIRNAFRKFTNNVQYVE